MGPSRPLEVGHPLHQFKSPLLERMGAFYRPSFVQIMLELGTGSLILVSCFGLLDGLTVTAAGPVAGAYIDRSTMQIMHQFLRYQI